jgi:hypothetical protein
VSKLDTLHVIALVAAARLHATTGTASPWRTMGIINNAVACQQKRRNTIISLETTSNVFN